MRGRGGEEERGGEGEDGKGRERNKVMRKGLISEGCD